MSERTSHTNAKMGSERNFGIVMTVAFAVIGVLPLLHGGQIRIWSLVVSGLFLVPTLIYPRVLKPLNVLWFKLGLLLGKVVAPIVMSLLFFVTFTPMALILRVLGKDPLRRKLDPNAQTYWISRKDGGHPMGSMRNQFSQVGDACHF